MYTRYLAHHDREYTLATYESRKFDRDFLNKNKSKVKDEKIFYRNWLNLIFWSKKSGSFEVKNRLLSTGTESSVDDATSTIFESSHDNCSPSRSYYETVDLFSSFKNSNFLVDLIQALDSGEALKLKKKRCCHFNNYSSLININSFIECLNYLNQKFQYRFTSFTYHDFLDADKKKILSFLFLIKSCYETPVEKLTHSLPAPRPPVNKKESDALCYSKFNLNYIKLKKSNSSCNYNRHRVNLLKSERSVGTICFDEIWQPIFISLPVTMPVRSLELRRELPVRCKKLDWEESGIETDNNSLILDLTMRSGDIDNKREETIHRYSDEFAQDVLDSLSREYRIQEKLNDFIDDIPKTNISDVSSSSASESENAAGDSIESLLLRKFDREIGDLIDEVVGMELKRGLIGEEVKLSESVKSGFEADQFENEGCVNKNGENEEQRVDFNKKLFQNATDVSQVNESKTRNKSKENERKNKRSKKQKKAFNNEEIKVEEFKPLASSSVSMIANVAEEEKAAVDVEVAEIVEAAKRESEPEKQRRNKKKRKVEAPVSNAKIEKEENALTIVNQKTEIIEKTVEKQESHLEILDEMKIDEASNQSVVVSSHAIEASMNLWTSVNDSVDNKVQCDSIKQEAIESKEPERKLYSDNDDEIKAGIADVEIKLFNLVDESSQLKEKENLFEIERPVEANKDARSVQHEEKGTDREGKIKNNSNKREEPVSSKMDGSEVALAKIDNTEVASSSQERPVAVETIKADSLVAEKVAKASNEPERKERRNKKVRVQKTEVLANSNDAKPIANSDVKLTQEMVIVKQKLVKIEENEYQVQAVEVEEMKSLSATEEVESKFEELDNKATIEQGNGTKKGTIVEDIPEQSVERVSEQKPVNVEMDELNKEKMKQSNIEVSSEVETEAKDVEIQSNTVKSENEMLPAQKVEAEKGEPIKVEPSKKGKRNHKEPRAEVKNENNFAQVVQKVASEKEPEVIKKENKEKKAAEAKQTNVNIHEALVSEQQLVEKRIPKKEKLTKKHTNIEAAQSSTAISTVKPGNETLMNNSVQPIEKVTAEKVGLKQEPLETAKTENNNTNADAARSSTVVSSVKCEEISTEQVKVEKLETAKKGGKRNKKESRAEAKNGSSSAQVVYEEAAEKEPGMTKKEETEKKGVEATRSSITASTANIENEMTADVAEALVSEQEPVKIEIVKNKLTKKHTNIEARQNCVKNETLINRVAAEAVDLKQEPLKVEIAKKENKKNTSDDAARSSITISAETVENLKEQSSTVFPRLKSEIISAQPSSESVKVETLETAKKGGKKNKKQAEAKNENPLEETIIEQEPEATKKDKRKKKDVEAKQSSIAVSITNIENEMTADVAEAIVPEQEPVKIEIDKTRRVLNDVSNKKQQKHTEATSIIQKRNTKQQSSQLNETAAAIVEVVAAHQTDNNNNIKNTKKAQEKNKKATNDKQSSIVSASKSSKQTKSECTPAAIVKATSLWNSNKCLFYISMFIFLILFVSFFTFNYLFTNDDNNNNISYSYS